MSSYETGPGPECALFADELAELALGIATGRQRADALAHVERCPNCHAEMEQMSLAADLMLEVTPAVEPPLGFEVRLAERLGNGRATPKSLGSRWRAGRFSFAMACLLAVAVLGAGVGAGWFARGGPPPAARSAFGTETGGHVATKALVSAGHRVGYVTVYSGGSAAAPGWMFMSLEVGSWSGEATCEVRLADGATMKLGTFWFDHGYGAWGVALPSSTGRISSASVLTGTGVLARAQFAASTTTSAPVAGLGGTSHYDGLTGT
jgi:hypothetical protein